MERHRSRSNPPFWREREREHRGGHQCGLSHRSAAWRRLIYIRWTPNGAQSGVDGGYTCTRTRGTQIEEEEEEEEREEHTHTHTHSRIISTRHLCRGLNHPTSPQVSLSAPISTEAEGEAPSHTPLPHLGLQSCQRECSTVEWSVLSSALLH